MSTLVLGLGNPILTDDGVGIHVVRQAAARFNGQGSTAVTFAEASVGGLRLLETITGYDRLILVDAIQTAGGIPGRCHLLRVDDMHMPLHAGSSHDLTFPGALAFGRSLGLALPADADILILAVEVGDVLSFGESLTPAVADALPRAVDEVLATLLREPPQGGGR